MTRRLPLQGLRVVVTRPRGQAPAFSRLLRDSGADVVEIPTIELTDPPDWSPADAALDNLAAYQMAVFTSVNGVERFLARGRSRGRDTRALGRLRLVAIGPATAEALRDEGFEVDILPGEYRAEGVIESVSTAAGGSLEGVRVLLPRALEAREILPEGLRRLGGQVDVVPVYQAVLPQGAAALVRQVFREGVDLITFTSSSTARNFVRLVGAEEVGGLLQDVVVGCIGPIAGDTARKLGLRVAIQPDHYTIEAFHRAVVAHFLA